LFKVKEPSSSAVPDKNSKGAALVGCAVSPVANGRFVSNETTGDLVVGTLVGINETDGISEGCDIGETVGAVVVGRINSSSPNPKSNGAQVGAFAGSVTDGISISGRASISKGAPVVGGPGTAN